MSQTDRTTGWTYYNANGIQDYRSSLHYVAIHKWSGTPLHLPHDIISDELSCVADEIAVGLAVS